MKRIFCVLIFLVGCLPTERVADRLPERDLCTVRMYDQNDILGKELTFRGDRLVSWTDYVTKNSVQISRNTFDDRGRIIKRTSHLSYAAEEERLVWFGPITARYDHAFERSERREWIYENGMLVSDTLTANVENPNLIIVNDFDYENGTLVQKTETAYHGTTNINITRYEYDAAKRLKKISIRSNGLDHDFGVQIFYSPAGSISSQNSFGKHGPHSEEVFEYDDEDRVVRKGPFRFEWSEDDRLIKTSFHATEIEHTYDASGRFIRTDWDQKSKTVAYDSGCPAGFKHPALEPSIVYQTYFEAIPYAEYSNPKGLRPRP